LSNIKGEVCQCNALFAETVPYLPKKLLILLEQKSLVKMLVKSWLISSTYSRGFFSLTRLEAFLANNLSERLVKGNQNLAKNSIF